MVTFHADSVPSVLQSWTRSRLQSYMRSQKISGRSQLKRKHDMINYIVGMLTPDQRESLLCATGKNFYWLKYTRFPTEVVSVIVNFIRYENMWWNALSLKDLENLLRVCVLFSPPCLTKHGMKMMMRSVLPDFGEAQKLHKEIKKAIMGRRANSMNVWHLRKLRKKYIYRNVEKYGPKYLLCVPTVVLITDIRNTERHFERCRFNGYHDRVMHVWMELNFPHKSFDMSTMISD